MHTKGLVSAKVGGVSHADERHILHELTHMTSRIMNALLNFVLNTILFHKYFNNSPGILI